MAYGYSLKDNPVIRAYQTSGPSLKVNEKGVPLPDWRLFRVDRMVDFINSGDIFNEAKPLYNPTGDKDMTKIYAQAKF